MKTSFCLSVAAMVMATCSLSGATCYVSLASTNPVPPYASWATSATNIQLAVDAAVDGDEILVTNGVYTTGGRAVGTNVLVNRVAVDKAVAVRSVNGPQFTVIQGYQVPGVTNGDGAIRCVYLGTGASLIGFTLTNGATRVSVAGDTAQRTGGGVWCPHGGPVVSNCIFTGNSAYNGGGAMYSGTLNNCTLIGNTALYGGGAIYGILNNCALISNSAYAGGGTFQSTLSNCTLAGNSAASAGGGAYSGTLNNCTLYFNTATSGAGTNYAEVSALNYCCTTPMPTNGVGNITNAPLFVDYGTGDLRLQSNSPCINSGRNAYAPGLTDLAGLPRIVSGTVDIGAYEFQGPGSIISYAWLQHYGLPTDGSADFAHTDTDGHNTWQEWRCLTDPANSLSALRMLSATRAGADVVVTWESVAGVNYFLQRSMALEAAPRFTTVATSISGLPGTTTYTDTNAPSAARLFYRAGVGN